MKKMFLSDSEFQHEIQRSRAKGHKSLSIDNEVESFSYIDMKTEDDVLKVCSAGEVDENEEEVYTILCKEFGLVGYRKDKFKSTVSVIFLDNGYMLVTLHKGGLVCRLDGKLMMPSVGVDSLPSFNEDDVYWVDAECLLGYSKFMEEKGRFIYDFEFMFVLGGDNTADLHSFSFKHLNEDDIDLSLGLFAQHLQRVQNKKDMKAARNLMKMVAEAQSNIEEDFFEDDDEDDEDEDDGLFVDDDDDF